MTPTRLGNTDENRTTNDDSGVCVCVCEYVLVRVARAWPNFKNKICFASLWLILF